MIDDGDLAGDLFQIPDKWWGFEAFGRRSIIRDRANDMKEVKIVVHA